MNKRSKKDILWDASCIASLIGIWPRYIEPNLLRTTYLNAPIRNLSKDLHGFKILQFSDLHLHAGISEYFIKKLTLRIKNLNPDCIVFTGDFLTCSLLDSQSRFLEFFNSFNARHGCFAVLGNHDYEQFVSVNESGNYSPVKRSSSFIGKGFKRLLSNINPTGIIEESVKTINKHEGLIALLNQTPFKLLHNETKAIRIGNCLLNICGLGEYALGKANPEKTFRKYQRGYPGVVLVHNPDALPLLDGYPGDIVLCGHTHGGQINLPWLWRKFTLMEHPEWKRGMHRRNNRSFYVNSGVGAALPFRFFSVPEITLITLTDVKETYERK